MEANSYQQPVKNLIRDRMLSLAIKRLTIERTGSCIIRESKLTATVEQFLGYLRDWHGDDTFDRPTRDELASWLAFHYGEVGQKDATALKVLYLCGPEPLNDLDVMLRHGINPHNVWAVTGSREDQASATAQCNAAGVPLKIHHGPLREFFDSFNQCFDIIYFDACGPFCGGNPNTLDPIVSLFERQRLASPGALITNFSAPPDDGDPRARFVDLVTAYYAPRHRDAPQIIQKTGPDPAVYQVELELLRQFATQNLDEIYSEFISALLTDLGMTLLPNCRALSMNSLFRQYLAPDNIYRKYLEQANAPSSKGDILGGDMFSSPSSHPLLSFIRNLEKMRPSDLVLQRLARPREGGTRNRADLLEAASLLNAVIEGHWEALSPTLREVVGSSWFDLRARLTCDVPLPNLLINSLLGIYARPWFVNPCASDRVTYVAKTRRMYCDLLLMDQCRSYYDWFPTVESCKIRFHSIPFQIVARCILDRIGRHNFSRESHPFYGAAVAGWKEIPAAEWFDLAERENVEA